VWGYWGGGDGDRWGSGGRWRLTLTNTASSRVVYVLVIPLRPQTSGIAGDLKCGGAGEVVMAIGGVVGEVEANVNEHGFEPCRLRSLYSVKTSDEWDSRRFDVWGCWGGGDGDWWGSGGGGGQR
jgi:hypothetical protein